MFSDKCSHTCKPFLCLSSTLPHMKCAVGTFLLHALKKGDTDPEREVFNPEKVGLASSQDLKREGRVNKGDARAQQCPSSPHCAWRPVPAPPTPYKMSIVTY